MNNLARAVAKFVAIVVVTVSFLAATKAQPYYVTSFYTGVNCTGTVLQTSSILATCIPNYDDNTGESYYCNSTHTTASLCDVSCSVGSCATPVTILLGCYPYTYGGSYRTSCDSSIPTMSVNHASLLSITGQQCDGTDINQIDFILGECFGTPEGYLSYTCDSSNVYRTNCTNSACTQDCITNLYPLGCLTSDSGIGALNLCYSGSTAPLSGTTGGHTTAPGYTSSSTSGTGSGSTSSTTAAVDAAQSTASTSFTSTQQPSSSEATSRFSSFAGSACSILLFVISVIT